MNNDDEWQGLRAIADHAPEQMEQVLNFAGDLNQQNQLHSPNDANAVDETFDHIRESILQTLMQAPTAPPGLFHGGSNGDSTGNPQEAPQKQNNTTSNNSVI